MVKIIESKADARGLRIGIIVSRFNQFITDKLLDGALDGLKSHGGEDERITVARVPGAFEILAAWRKKWRPAAIMMRWFASAR